MRILVVSNLYPPDVLGGYEMGCKQAVDALRAAGHDVLVLAGQPRSCGVPHDPAVRRWLKFVDVFDEYYYEKARQQVVRSLRHSEACHLQSANVQAVADAVDEFRPDVAYVWNLVALGGLGLLAALQHMGVPWVMHLMDDVPAALCAAHRGGPLVPGLAATFRQALRGRFICCSRTTVNEIAAAGLDLTELTTIIPNWVVAGTTARTDYLPGGRLRLISAGTMTTHKGTDIAILAAAELRRMGVENFELDLYGRLAGPVWTRLIRDCGVADRVRVLGERTQAELYALYPRYDAFVFPTWAREPMAFAPLEAMAFGCVPVLSRVNGNAEWVADGVDCLKADRDPKAFADVLARIASGEVDVRGLGRRAAEAIRRGFRLDVLVKDIEAVLRQAVRDGGGPARPPSEAYHVALLAEKTFQCLINEAA